MSCSRGFNVTRGRAQCPVAGLCLGTVVVLTDPLVLTRSTGGVVELQLTFSTHFTIDGAGPTS